jgi:multicomponent Na+:H+ antiporter subunit D
MNTIISSKLIIAPLIPMATSLLIMASGRKPNLRETFSVAGAVLTFLTVISLLPHVLAGGTWDCNLVTIYPGISLKFHLDGLGILFDGTASYLWIVAAFYCIGYMRGLNEHAQTRFYVCYALSVGAGVGAAFSVVFQPLPLCEMISIFYPGHAHQDDGDTTAARNIIYRVTSRHSSCPRQPAVCGAIGSPRQGVAASPANADRTMGQPPPPVLFGFARVGDPSGLTASRRRGRFDSGQRLLHAVVVVRWSSPPAGSAVTVRHQPARPDRPRPVYRRFVSFSIITHH